MVSKKSSSVSPGNPTIMSVVNTAPGISSLMTTRPLTAVDTRLNPSLGLSGLIVGLPNIPELGADIPRVVAFDLACPCYEDFSTTRNLQLKEGGRAVCTRCGRTYDLNNQGIVADGPSGRSLFRYRTNYNAFGNTLTVNN